ncbi:hypothetical protein DRP04_06680 [Archaeoglobales archaeon]|nr:MAG: hypothetical protein DRP04_06680 [Archaeoglobales archaeon]
MMWENYRESKLKKYREAKNNGELDVEIVPLLELVNSHPKYVTLSSCSGRIAVLDIEKFGDKVGAKFLGKWHEKVDADAVEAAAKRSLHRAWFILYPPIIHVACKDFDAAKILLKIANNAGFRRSGLISLKNFVIEVSSLERLELPIAEHGEMLVSKKYLELVLDVANRKLESGRDKIARFTNLFKFSLMEGPQRGPRILRSQS